MKCEHNRCTTSHTFRHSLSTIIRKTVSILWTRILYYTLLWFIAIFYILPKCSEKHNGVILGVHYVTFSSSSSSSSIGTTTPCWVLAYSTVVEYSQQEGFYRVPLPAARQTPNLEDQWLERSKFRHKGPPTSEATRVNPAAKGGAMGEKWPRILPKVATSTSLLGSFTCRKLRRKACWGFFRPKNPTASAGFECKNSGTKGQHATSRPPKPLPFHITHVKWQWM